MAVVVRDLAALRCVSREVGAWSMPGWKAVLKHCSTGHGLVRALCKPNEGSGAAACLLNITRTCQTEAGLTEYHLLRAGTSKSCSHGEQGQYGLAHDKDEGKNAVRT